jgi:hypothetical protein
MVIYTFTTFRSFLTMKNKFLLSMTEGFKIMLMLSEMMILMLENISQQA